VLKLTQQGAFTSAQNVTENGRRTEAKAMYFKERSRQATDKDIWTEQSKTGWRKRIIRSFIIMIYLSMALQSLWTLAVFQFLNLNTVGRTPVHRKAATYTQKNTNTE
jgi:hypothetical protein